MPVGAASLNHRVCQGYLHMEVHSRKSAATLRAIVQWCFMAWVVGIGIRFGMFVAAMERGTAVPPFSRPPGVEGFLPIGALASLKYWLVSGSINPVHPAARFVFLTGIATGMVNGHWYSSLNPAIGTSFRLCRA